MVDKKVENLSARILHNNRRGNIESYRAKVIAQIRKAHLQSVEKDGQREFTVVFVRVSVERCLAALEQFRLEMARTHTVLWKREAAGKSYLVTVIAIEGVEND